MIFSLSWLSPPLLKDTTISSRTRPCVEIFRTQIIILLLNLECTMSQKCQHTLAFVARLKMCLTILRRGTEYTLVIPQNKKWNFFSKCGQIRKKALMENFIFWWSALQHNGSIVIRVFQSLWKMIVVHHFSHLKYKTVYKLYRIRYYRVSRHKKKIIKIFYCWIAATSTFNTMSSTWPHRIIYL